jgi:dihydrofolate reductase
MHPTLTSPTQTPPTLTLIAAFDRHFAIGRAGQIPWDLPDDMRHFIQSTRGKPVVMGRRTWDSLWIKPLPKRLNVVMTRLAPASTSSSTSSSPAFPPGVLTARSLTEAISMTDLAPEVMIIGGGDIYTQSLPFASRMILTHIDAEIPDADAFFPRFNPDEWAIRERVDHPTDDRHALPFSIITYERLAPPQPIP